MLGVTSIVDEGRVSFTTKYAEACGNMNKWQLDLTQSKFVDWQKGGAQENSADTPGGSMSVLLV